MRKAKKKVTRKKPAKRKAAPMKKVAKKKVVKRKVVKKKVVKKVRCAAKTKEGKRCKRMVAPPAKKCHLHRGKR